jgi:hypothetical protein
MVLELQRFQNQKRWIYLYKGLGRKPVCSNDSISIQHAKTGRQTSKLRLVACTQSEGRGGAWLLVGVGRHCEWVRWLRGCSGLAVVCCWWLKFEPRDDAGQDPNFEQEHK